MGRDGIIAENFNAVLLIITSRYAEAARKDIFMRIATEKRSISLEFKTNRQ